MIDLLTIVNTVLENKGLPAISQLLPHQKLRDDLGFDSFDLAELTVRIEDACGIDVFATGIIETVGEIEVKLAA
ncbi:MAG: acyl carrier protein [Bacteroidetes bacterium]|nr:MAG: acyl carrier protein [Bacteroidota bacterium]